MTADIWKKWWSGYCETKRSDRLRRQLTELLHDRSDTIQRSLDLQKRQHPGQPESWYLDKVIYDFERAAEAYRTK